MMHKAYIILVLLVLSCTHASAQLSNRQKVIALMLEEHKLKLYHASSYQPEVLATSPSILCAPVNPVPKYSLPKGNVFCRMEDYVQMHTPMKLNIGVGGQ